MALRAFGVGVALAVIGAGTLPAQTPPIQGEEDARSAAKFIKGLSEKGYPDLAAEYLEHLRNQPDAPAELRETIDYEVGRLLLDEAQKTGDQGRQRDLIDQARARLEAFTKSSPKHPLAPDALVQLAKLLVLRGHIAMLVADDTEVKAERETKLAEARGSFDQARQTYDAAVKTLQTAYDGFSNNPNDPRKDDRDKAHDALMQAMLQRAVVDYEQGQTYPIKSTQRNELMSNALKQFETIYKKYRTQMAGLAARMWEGKCYEERGDLGPAMGIYNELLEHGDPHLVPLQRHVGYFKIITLGKRKEYALAADTAVKWLQQVNNTPASLRQPEVIGVQFELAKNIIAQLPDLTSEADKAAATKKVVETLGKVVRYSSPYKSEAIEMLRKYKPKAAENAMDVARLNYDDAVAMADQAVGSREWDRAAALYKQAVRKAEAVRDVDKTVYARHHLAFCYYMNKNLYEAAVLADHLARRYPRASLSPKTANIGLAALAEAFKTYNQIDSQSDLKNLIDLAEYTAETFPQIEEGDTAKHLLGQVYQSTQRYEKAVQAFDSVRPTSQKRVDAQNRAGVTHWWMSQGLRRAGKTPEADAEVGKALATLQATLKARRDAGEAASDPAFIGNACDIAEIDLETSKPDEALKLLEPIAKAQATPSGPAYFSLVSHILRAHIALNQVDRAMTDMALIEKSGETGNALTQLYYGLGKLLEKEIEALDKKGDKVKRNQAQQSFLKFLAALTTSKSGQTFQSLQWAGENMLRLGDAKESEVVFHKLVDTYGKDPKFLETPGAADRVMLWKVGLSSALRGQGKFADAETLVSGLIQDNPKKIEPLMEKAMLMESEAEAKKIPWTKASANWRALALRLGNARTKPAEYYDAWYHAALALNRDGKGKEAKQTLGSIMRLSPKVGGPEMKKKYESLLAQIKS